MSEELLSKAKAKYGFLKNVPMRVIVNPKDSETYAETWPANEPGNEKYKRPADIPINELGVEIYKPDQFNEDDLAGEALHVDPIARKTADAITSSLNGDQIKQLAINSGDYQHSLELGLPEERAVQNAVDSMLRGYVVGQWPKEAIDSIGLDDQQKTMLQKLKDYVVTGKTEEQQLQDGFDASFDTSGNE